VNDDGHAIKSSLPEALKNLLASFVILVVWCLFLYFIGEIIDKNIGDSGTRKVIGILLAGAFIASLFYFWLKIKAVLSSLFKPNLKTPEKAVESYISALKKGLHERAYNLLTDKAQKLSKLVFPKEDKMQQKMPDLYYEDLNSFKSFWNSIQFPWKQHEYSRPKAEIINESTALVKTKIVTDRIVDDMDEYDFTAKFVTVKRENKWFLANGYFWPQKE
jgi:hypothetical protein